MAVLTLGLFACDRNADLENRVADLEGRVEKIQEVIDATNANALAIRALLNSSNLIVGHTENEDGVTLNLSDGTTVSIVYGDVADWIVPVLGIDESGRWCISLDGGKTFTYVKKTTGVHDADGITPQISTDSDGYWTISYDGGKTFERILTSDGLPISAIDGREVSGTYAFFKNVEYDEKEGVMIFNLLTGQTLKVGVVETFYLNVKGYTEKAEITGGQTLAYEVEMSDIADAVFNAPEGWGAVLTDSEMKISAPEGAKDGEYTVTLIVVSAKGYVKSYSYSFAYRAASDAEGCKVWNDFVARNADNILLDYSYAGYDHGESAPADVYTLGYKVYNVCDYGAVPDDGKSDREAFLSCLKAALGVDYTTSDTYVAFASKPQANAIVYFPEGEFILHTSEDNTATNTLSIIIRSGNIVLKGAGREKTRIVMQDPALPTSSELYSSPCMLQFYHFSGLTDLANVSSNAEKGDFSVEVSGTSGISKGSWVCLCADVTDPSYIAQELQPYEVKSTWDISKCVTIRDYHQVKSVVGSTVTFEEPIMHAVDASKGFSLKKFNCYENVGVEDLTFVGNAKQDFVHHGSWQDDGGYKPLNFMRCADSWVRRVDFESVSEACNFHTSANCTAYDIRFTGWRGHAALRAASSSRILIAATKDRTHGQVNANNPTVAQGTYMENAGQFHAVGVNGCTMGTVLWRNVWGDDACFESHASQPRATLIDCCKGGWMEYRAGGATEALPNHLADLTIWNFESTTDWKSQFTDDGSFLWWATGSKSINFLPPIIVGFHGKACTFNPSSVVCNESYGTAVNPGSLYEAQLTRRLGYVPGWLNSLK